MRRTSLLISQLVFLFFIFEHENTQLMTHNWDIVFRRKNTPINIRTCLYVGCTVYFECVTQNLLQYCVITFHQMLICALCWSDFYKNVFFTIAISQSFLSVHWLQKLSICLSFFFFKYSAKLNKSHFFLRLSLVQVWNICFITYKRAHLQFFSKCFWI